MRWLVLAFLCTRSIFDCNAAAPPAIRILAPNDESQAIGWALYPILAGQTGFEKLLKTAQSDLILDDVWKFVVMSSSKTVSRDHFSRMTVYNTIHVYSNAKLSHDPHAPPSYVFSHNGEFWNTITSFKGRANANEHVFVLATSLIEAKYAEPAVSTPTPLPAPADQKENELFSVSPVSVIGSTDEARAIGDALAPLLIKQNGFKMLLPSGHHGLILEGAWKFVVQDSNYDTTRDYFSKMNVYNTIAIYSTARLCSDPNAPHAYVAYYHAAHRNVLKRFEDRAEAKVQVFVLEQSRLAVSPYLPLADVPVTSATPLCKVEALPAPVEVAGPTDEAQVIGKALAPLLLEQNSFTKLLPVGQSGLILHDVWKYVVQQSDYTTTRNYFSFLGISSTIAVYSTASLCDDPAAPPVYTVSHKANYDNVLAGFNERAQAEEHAFNLRDAKITVYAS